MTKAMAETLDGGCHCGAIRFRIRLERPAPESEHVESEARESSRWQGLECNCSMCTKSGFLHYIVDRDRFELLCGIESISEYRFNTGVAVHTFCSVCGIKPFYTPRSHPDRIDINLRCLDGDAIERFQVRQFDGRNWEDSIDSIR